MKIAIIRAWIILLVFSILSCSFSPENRTGQADPDFDSFKTEATHRLEYYAHLFPCDKDSISIYRPSYLTISANQKIKISVEDDTITSINIKRGQFRHFIYEKQGINNPSFTFHTSRFLCGEAYRKYTPSLRIQINSKKLGTAFLNISTHKGDEVSFSDN